MMRAWGERCLVPLLIVSFLTASLLYLYTAYTPPSHHTEDSEDSSELRLLMQKGVESWTEEETETFLQLKESQYSVMRERVRRFCQQGQVRLDCQSRNNNIARNISPMEPPGWRWSTMTRTRCPTVPFPRWRAPPGAGISSNLVRR